MRCFLFAFILTLACVCVRAADITKVSNAFKTGNVSLISDVLDKEVDISLPDATKKCGNDEAVSMLSSFFRSNKSSGFSVVHHADKKGNGFLVGKLNTTSGEYRVNVTYRVEGDIAIIQSIRIE